MKPDDAIDAAKSAWKQPTGEPLVADGQVILRHLWDALERVSGLSDTAAKKRILDALCSGTLIARTFKDHSIIPSPTWKSTRSFSDGWLLGEIHFDHDLPGYKGQLPVITRKEAETWLKAFAPLPKAGRPLLKFKAAEAYRQRYPVGHKAEDVSWKSVAREVSRLLKKNVSVATIQRGLGQKK